MAMPGTTTAATKLTISLLRNAFDVGSKRSIGDPEAGEQVGIQRRLRSNEGFGAAAAETRIVLTDKKPTLIPALAADVKRIAEDSLVCSYIC
jgi:hypothetical protein